MKRPPPSRSAAFVIAGLTGAHGRLSGEELLFAERPTQMLGQTHR